VRLPRPDEHLVSTQGGDAVRVSLDRERLDAPAIRPAPVQSAIDHRPSVVEVADLTVGERDRSVEIEQPGVGPDQDMLPVHAAAPPSGGRRGSAHATS
jgi:hypothetical protein